MDHLNKQQIVLLCLLVSFVTAIVTGIVTISLSEQFAGQSVQQTIYKVVERTIEKVTLPDSPVRKIVEEKKPEPPAQLQLSDIAEKAGNSLVRIYRFGKNREEKEFVSLGLIVGSKGAVLSFAKPENRGNFSAFDGQGKEIPLALQEKNLPFEGALFLMSDPNSIIKSSISLNSISDLKIGTNVIAFGGKEDNNVVSTGIITEFVRNGGTSASSTPEIAVTDVTLSSRQSGWILLDTLSRVIGISIPSPEGDTNARYLDMKIISSGISENL